MGVQNATQLRESPSFDESDFCLRELPPHQFFQQAMRGNLRSYFVVASLDFPCCTHYARKCQKTPAVGNQALLRKLITDTAQAASMLDIEHACIRRDVDRMQGEISQPARREYCSQHGEQDAAAQYSHERPSGWRQEQILAFCHAANRHLGTEIVALCFASCSRMHSYPRFSCASTDQIVLNTSVPLVPPKPKEFESATLIFICLAVLAT